MRSKPDGTPVKLLCVCGWGVGSSMMLRMLAEEVVGQIGLYAELEHTDFTSAKGMVDGYDVVVGQEMHTAPFADQVPILVTVNNFVETEPIRAQLEAGLARMGWG